MILSKLPFYKAGRTLLNAELCALDLLDHKANGLNSFQFTYLFEAYCIHVVNFWELVKGMKSELRPELKSIIDEFAKHEDDLDSPVFYLKTARNQLMHIEPVLHNSALNGEPSIYPNILFEGETFNIKAQLYSSITLPTFAFYAGTQISLQPVTDRKSWNRLNKKLPVPRNDDGMFMAPLDLVKETYHQFGKMFNTLVFEYRKCEP